MGRFWKDLVGIHWTTTDGRSAEIDPFWNWRTYFRDSQRHVSNNEADRILIEEIMPMPECRSKYEALKAYERAVSGHSGKSCDAILEYKKARGRYPRHSRLYLLARFLTKKAQILRAAIKRAT